jgi:hypothetical protein
LPQFPIDRIKSDADSIFTADLKKLENRLTERGLDNSYRRMQTDVDYRIAQAYLHVNEERTKLDPQIRFVLGRIIICTKVVLELFKELHGSVIHLIEISNFLSGGESFHTDRLNTIFQVGRLLDTAKGCEREIENIIEDYCHYMDLMYHLMGEDRELYGTRLRSDIQKFQTASAIRQLLQSRTEARNAAGLLIRSLMENSIRQSIFHHDVASDVRHFPKNHLALPTILDYCNRNGLPFRYSNETFNLLWENLNLVVHFGFNLDSATLWYMFWIANSAHLVVKGGRSAALPKIRQVLENLAADGYVERVDVSAADQRGGLTIFWRY